MADSSKPNQEGSSGSQDIFNEGEHSAYEEAMSAPVEDLKQQEVYSKGQEEQAPSQDVYQDPSTESQPDSVSAPPPFVDDPRKKIIFIALFFIFIIIGGLFVVRLMGSRKESQQNNAAVKEVKLVYWGLWEEVDTIKPVIDEYVKNRQNVTIEYIRQDPTQYRERLQASIDRGEGPDIFRFHNSWVPMMNEHLAPLPKEIMSDEEFAQTFYPVAASDLSVSGNYYGLPLEIDGLLLYYNQDILDGANVPVPKTWVDVQNTVPELTVKEGNSIVTSAIAMGTAENIEHFSDLLGLMMLQNGTDLKSSLFQCADSQSTSCAVETLAFYRKFAEPPNNTWDNTLENSILAFAQGKVAMIFAPAWQAEIIRSINPDLEFRTAKVPQLPCNTVPCPQIHWASYWVEGVSPKSENQTEAWLFLKFLIQKDTLQKYYQEQAKVRTLFGEPFSRVDMAGELKDNQYLSPLIEEAPDMQSFYLASKTNDGETGINSSLNEYLKNAVNSLSEGVSEESALETADNGFKEVFERFNISSGN